MSSTSTSDPRAHDRNSGARAVSVTSGTILTSSKSTDLFENEEQSKGTYKAVPGGLKLDDVALPASPGAGKAKQDDDNDVDDKAKDNRKCHKCAKVGHIARNCPAGGGRFPRGSNSRKTKKDEAVVENVLAHNAMLKGVNDANVELVKDLQLRIKELEGKKPVRQLPNADQLLPNTMSQAPTRDFDDRATVPDITSYSRLAIAVACALCLFWSVVVAKVINNELIMSLRVFVSWTLFVSYFVWLATREWNGKFSKAPTRRYRWTGNVPVVPATDERDPNTKSQALLFTDPQFATYDIIKLRTTEWYVLTGSWYQLLWTVLTFGLFSDECVEEVREERMMDVVQHCMISKKLFDLLRNPRVMSKTDNREQTYDRMLRFCESTSFVNVPHVEESSLGVRAATMDVAFNHLYGYWSGTRQSCTHRFEPGLDLKETGPPR